MLVFGLIHGFLLWFGAILTLYAISGFLVLRATRWTVKRLTVVGVGLVAVAQVPMALLVWGAIVTGEKFMEVPLLPFNAAALATAQVE